MTDVNSKTPLSSGSEPSNGVDPSQLLHGDQASCRYDLIELLFFAYRDFTAMADDRLAEFDFGRAHHRVLHFVHRNPGIMVTDLLTILQITKQSLGRVLKQLVDQDFIEQQPGPIDRRQRLLHATPKGHELASHLVDIQSELLNRAIKDLPDDGAALVKQFLIQMLDTDKRDDIVRLVSKTYRPVPPVG
ncbi:MAG: MarR family transcriptional regulator [Rhodobacteraceae bacterium]|nr:MarR family transcriptional regulator [Paracoccaceae bacterium]